MSFIRILSGITLVLAHTDEADKTLCDALDLLLDVPCEVPGPVILLATVVSIEKEEEKRREVDSVKKYLAVRPPHQQVLQKLIVGDLWGVTLDWTVEEAGRIARAAKAQIEDRDSFSPKQKPFQYAVKSIDLASVKLLVADARAANAAAKKKKKQEKDEDYEPPAKKRRGAGREAAPSPRPRAKKGDD